MYENGRGVAENYEKAIEYYGLGCEIGYISFCDRLGEVYDDLGNKELAAKYHKLGCYNEDNKLKEFMDCADLGFSNLKAGNIFKAGEYFRVSCNIGENNETVRNNQVAQKRWRDACLKLEEIRYEALKKDEQER